MKFKKLFINILLVSTIFSQVLLGLGFNNITASAQVEIIDMFCGQNLKLYSNSDYPEMKICYDPSWEIEEEMIDDFSKIDMVTEVLSLKFIKQGVSLEYIFYETDPAAVWGESCPREIVGSFKPDLSVEIGNKMFRFQDERLVNNNFLYRNKLSIEEQIEDYIKYGKKDPENIFPNCDSLLFREMDNRQRTNSIRNVPAQFTIILSNTDNQEIISQADEIVLNSCFSDAECERLRKIIELESFCGQDKKLYINPNYPEMRVCYDPSWDLKESNQPEPLGLIFSKEGINLQYDFYYNVPGSGVNACMPSQSKKPDILKNIGGNLFRLKYDEKSTLGKYIYTTVDFNDNFEICPDYRLYNTIKHGRELTPQQKQAIAQGSIPEDWVTRDILEISLDNTDNQEIISQADEIVLNSCFSREECEGLRESRLLDAVSSDQETLKDLIGMSSSLIEDIKLSGLYTGNITEDYLWNYQVVETPTITFKKGWLRGWHLEKIEGFNPKMIKTIKETDFRLGADVDLGKIKDQYNFYGIAPYKDMDIKIRFVDGGKTVKERTEKLDSAKWMARGTYYRYGHISLTSWEENRNEFGRIGFGADTRWDIDPRWDFDPNNNKITYNESVWIDSRIKHSTRCPDGSECKISGLFTHPRKASNRISIKNNIERLKYNQTGIEAPFVVKGDNSDTSGFIIPYNKNERYVKFIDINENAGDRYDGKSKVWILSHGWNGQLGVMNQIGQNIAKDDVLKDDIVLQLDWREVSWNLLAVCSASTWTRPLSFEIEKKLNEWGLKEEDYENVRLVGHSLGTILNTEIGMRLNSKPEMTISLDPPSDPCIGGYNVQDPPGWDNEIKKSDLNKSGQKTRSFVGFHSIAGSQGHNRTAHISIRNDYTSKRTNKKEHGWVQETWRYLIDTDRLESDILGARDENSHSSWRRLSEATLLNPIDEWQDNHALLRNVKPTVKETHYGKEDIHIQPGEVKYLEYNFYDHTQKKERKDIIYKKTVFKP